MTNRQLLVMGSMMAGGLKGAFVTFGRGAVKAVNTGVRKFYAAGKNALKGTTNSLNNAAGRVRQWSTTFGWKVKPGELKPATSTGKLKDGKGHFVKGHQGAKVYAETEVIGAKQFIDRGAERGKQVVEIIDYKKMARVDGAPNRRYYDRIIRLDDGTWIGLEVKSGNARIKPAQKLFGRLVTPDNPARVTLKEGRRIDIIGVFLEQLKGL